MNIYIYKIKNDTTLENIEPEYLLSIICLPIETHIEYRYDEDGNIISEYEVSTITKYYPNFNNETMMWVESFIKYPKLVDGKLVEKTTEELKIEGILPLEIGEIIENEEVKTIQIPIDLYKPIWNEGEWVESATEEELSRVKLENDIWVNKTTEELKIDGVIDLVDGEYVEDNNLIIVPYTDSFYKPIWVSPKWVESATDEEIKAIYIEQIRSLRTPKLSAYDKLATNKAVGVEVIEDPQWQLIIDWRQVWLDLPDMVEIDKSLEEQIPITPSEIQYYERV